MRVIKKKAKNKNEKSIRKQMSLFYLEKKKRTMLLTRPAD